MPTSEPASRHVLFVPREQIERLLASQGRQDVKLVVPTLMTAAKAAALHAEGRGAKLEVPLVGESWMHVEGETIPVCESRSFALPDTNTVAGPFALSFALPGAPQSMHVHQWQWELYYSEQALSVAYRTPDSEPTPRRAELSCGGLALFGPGVEHRVDPTGLMLVVSFPSVDSDKTGCPE